MQKWPNSITAIRHVKSAYNAINKDEIPGYKDFSEQFNEEYGKLNLEVLTKGNFPSPSLLKMAIEIAPLLGMHKSDYDTPIAIEAENQAITTGQKLLEHVDLPNIIYVSPYHRTRETLKYLQEGCPALANVRVIEDDRIREQEYGMQAVYTDWRLYFTFNPRQALLKKRATAYEYKHEQGESLLDVRNRLRDFVAMLIREHGGTESNKRKPENVMLVTHHLAIMAMRANIERWTREQFLDNDKNKRPPNCSLTTYEGVETSPERSPQGQDGRLVLKHENLVLY